MRGLQGIKVTLKKQKKMKKKNLLPVIIATVLSCSLFAADLSVSHAADSTGVAMYRLYNPNSGEHFYTSAVAEKDNLASLGWADEDAAWTAPTSSDTPVYRLYNQNSGEHHYTGSAGEKDYLLSLGWNDEGIGWYSDDDQGEPVYRLYNPNATGQYAASAHHFTKDMNEKNILIAAGWNDEGIGWYGTDESAEKYKEDASSRKRILVGDSRTVMMHNEVGDEGCIWSEKAGADFSWMSGWGVPSIESQIDGNTDIVILMGVNDCYEEFVDDRSALYYTYLNKKAADWKEKGARTFFVSVNPLRQPITVDYGEGIYTANNGTVVRFNSIVSSNLSSDVIWIETYSAIKDHIAYIDTYHYMPETSMEIFDLIMRAL